MPHQPTPDNIAALRRLLADAGSKRTLYRWVKALPNVSKGGRPAANDKPLLAGLEVMCLLAGERQGMLKRLAKADTKGVFGKNVKAVTARWADRLRKRGFTKKQLDAMMKAHGIPDPSKVTFRRYRKRPK